MCKKKFFFIKMSNHISHIAWDEEPDHLTIKKLHRLMSAAMADKTIDPNLKGIQRIKRAELEKLPGIRIIDAGSYEVPARLVK